MVPDSSVLLFIYKQKKSEIKPPLFNRVCGDFLNLKLERLIRKLFNPGRLNVYKLLFLCCLYCVRNRTYDSL